MPRLIEALSLMSVEKLRKLVESTLEREKADARLVEWEPCPPWNASRRTHLILLATSIDETLRDSIRLVVPEAALIGAACVLFILSTLKTSRQAAGALALAGLALAGLLHVVVARPADLIATAAPALGDSLALFIRATAL